jgi:hypothetical protein
VLPLSHNYSIVRGDCLHLDLVYKAANVPVDLTGWTGEWLIVWGDRQNERVSIPLTLTAQGQITAAATGPTTQNFKSPTRHAVRLTAPDGCVSTILRGFVAVDP